MTKKSIRRLLILLSILLITSLACSYTRQFTEWYRDYNDDEEEQVEVTMCSDNLLLGDVKITCDQATTPKVHSFSGIIYNNSDRYAHNVSISVEFTGGFPIPSCTFDFAEIAPGATVEALCQFSTQKCGSTLSLVSNDTCDMMYYPEHLDWLAANEKDPDPEKKEPFELSQTQIDFLHDTYKQSFADNPCEPDIAKQAFVSWLLGQANTWSDEAGKIVGEGKQFPDLETFKEWLTGQAKIDEISPITKSWNSDIELAISPLVSCFACTPPKLTGTLDLTVDLKTCQVTGKFSANGEGDVTINDCVDNKPIDETCTSHGKLGISGDVTGTVTKSGQLNLEPTKSNFTYSTQWVDGCEWDSQDVQNSDWEDPITITGSFEWEGSATGKIHWASSVCQMAGDWTASQE